MIAEFALTFVLLALGVFRLAELIAVDDGPADMFKRIRLKCGGYDLAENGEPDTSLGKMIICPYCLGIYIAFFACLLANFFDPLLAFSLTLIGIARFIIYWWALAGAQAFLQTVGGRK